MSERAAKRIYDGFRSVEGGVDSGLSPELIEPNQIAWGTNITMRGGKARTRPPLIRRPFYFDPGANTPYDSSVEARLNAALYQTTLAYRGDNDAGSLLIFAGGRLYEVDVQNGFAVTDVSPITSKNPPNLSRGWAVQAELFAIFQDSQTKPIIFNGSGSRYATEEEIKTGTVMAYQNGRIWYSVGTTGLAFRATDIVGDKTSGTAAFRYRDSVLKETENTFLNEGGDFAVPSTSGPITAMAAPAQLDTSQGQGPLQVLTTNAIFSINAPVDRTTWKDVTYPIQTFSMIEKGAIGWATLVNGDIWYRSDDGVRSFIVARREFGDWGNTPQSSEVSRVLDYDNGYLLPFGSAVLFDNRLIAAAAPALLPNGACVHDQLAILDFRLVSGLKRKLPPSWEGVWTGLRVHQVVKGRFNGVERCFLLCRDTANTQLQLWELLPDVQGIAYEDRASPTVTHAIPCFLETRALDFNNENALKRLDVAALFVSNLSGTVAFDVKYRPDSYPCWVDWHNWSECATTQQCFTGPACATLKSLQPQYRPKMKLPLPSDDCDPTLRGKLMRDFFELQLRIAWVGQATIERTLVSAIDQPEPAHGACLGVETCKELECCVEPLVYDAGAGVAVTTWDCVNNTCVDPGDGSGAYATLAECEAVCGGIAPTQPSWNCVDGACVDPGDGTGTYSTLAACEAACAVVPPVSYNCIDGTCVDPGDGTGEFSTLEACQENCIPITYICDDGACIDPGDGSGEYSTLLECQIACGVSPSWNCIDGACIDPGDGSGTYATLEECEAACVTYNCIDCQCIDPGDGSGTYATLAECEAACVDLPPEPVAYWKLDEATGQLRLDSIGTNDLTDNNTVVGAPGVINNGASFDPALLQYLSHVNDPVLEIAGDALFYISFWVKTPPVLDGLKRAILSKGGTDHEYGFNLEATGKFTFFFRAQAGIQPPQIISNTYPTVVVADTWYWVIGWRDPGGIIDPDNPTGAPTINIQVDDAPFQIGNAGTPGIPLLGGAGAFKLGYNQTDSSYWNGMLDEVSLWRDVRLSLCERLTIYNARRGRTCCPFQLES